MFDISFPIAFVSGLISFFAPCVVPLLPAYIGYVAGVSIKDLELHGAQKYRKKLILSSVLYILGFSLVFVILGTAAAGVGQLLRQFEDAVRIIGGALVLIFGLSFSGVLRVPLLAREYGFKFPAWANHLGHGRAFLIGIVFATVWTPCVGTILGAILALAAVSQTALTGAALLFTYSLGISIPFLVVSLTLLQAPKYLPLISKNIGMVSKIAGLILILLGILLLTNTYKFVNSWLFEIAFRLGYQIR